MQDNGGAPPAAAPAATSTTTTADPPAAEPADEPTPEPVKPAKADKKPKNSPPVASKTLEPGENDTTTLDPPFLRKNTDAAEPATPAAAATPNPAAPTDQAADDEVFASHLSKRTNGLLKTPDDWTRHVNDYNKLVEEAAKGFEPKFANERAKWAHQLLTQAGEGTELDTVERTLRALKFKPDGKSTKDILFEKYVIDPKNADISPSDVRKYFEAEYEDRYELLSKPKEERTAEEERKVLVLEREQATAVKEARETFQKIQTEFKATEAKPNQLAKEVEGAITRAVGGFGGVEIPFTDNPQPNEILRIPVADQATLQALQQEILDPDAARQAFLQEFATDNGGMDYPNLVRELYEMKNHRAIRQQTFDHAFKLGQLAQINADRNATKPKEISRVATPGGSPKKAANVFDAWAEATQKQQA